MTSRKAQVVRQFVLPAWKTVWRTLEEPLLVFLTSTVKLLRTATPISTHTPYSILTIPTALLAFSASPWCYLSKLSMFNLRVRSGHFLSASVLNPPPCSWAIESLSNRIRLFPLLSAQADINPVSRGVICGPRASPTLTWHHTRPAHASAWTQGHIFSIYKIFP